MALQLTSSTKQATLLTSLSTTLAITRRLRMDPRLEVSLVSGSLICLPWMNIHTDPGSTGRLWLPTAHRHRLEQPDLPRLLGLLSLLHRLEVMPLTRQPGLRFSSYLSVCYCRLVPRACYRSGRGNTRVASLFEAGPCMYRNGHVSAEWPFCNVKGGLSLRDVSNIHSLVRA